MKENRREDFSKEDLWDKESKDRAGKGRDTLEESWTVRNGGGDLCELGSRSPPATGGGVNDAIAFPFVQKREGVGEVLNHVPLESDEVKEVPEASLQ
jgi:hypothetical protein